MIITFKGTFLDPITTSGDASGQQQADMKAALDANPDVDAVFAVGPVIAHDTAAAVAERRPAAGVAAAAAVQRKTFR